MSRNDSGPGPLDYIKAWPQYLLPGHLLSRVIFALTRIRFAPLKNRFIDHFIRLYKIDMSEAVEEEAHAFEHFNAFFTRALRPGARPLPEDPAVAACPVDGTVSQLGPITDGRIFQAKGRDYTLEQLLGGAERAAPFHGGSFATIYLAPSNYHRIHMPLAGKLKEMVHVPGRLFSVNPATTRVIPGLFARNERVVALFETEAGPMALVNVGALFVAGIETVWSGLVTPPAGRVMRHWHYQPGEVSLKRGDEMGRFNMGSTVIVLFGPQAVGWAETLQHGTPVRMGQPLATLAETAEPREGVPAMSEPEHPTPQEPEPVACEVCLKEIPASVAKTAEGGDYIHHFCGIECLEAWRAKENKEAPPEEDDIRPDV